jgi:malonyl CoA-acyl carrier protein transacylase
MPTAIVFPGQGSQTPEMRDHAVALRPDLVALVGEESFERAAESTRFAQPAIFAASLAGFGALEGAPDAVAGHSLGELAAFVAAGAIDEADGVRLVKLRGELMAQATGGGMLAVLGGDRDEIAAIADRHGVTVANDNAPGQIVLSGLAADLDAAAQDIEARTMRLPVTGAFHSPAMAVAAAPFAEALAATEIRLPRVQVYSCVTAAPVDDPAEIRAVLADGLTRPVRWRETVTAMRAAGIDSFTETGPGRVLTGLIKRIPEAARV